MRAERTLRRNPPWSSACEQRAGKGGLFPQWGNMVRVRVTLPDEQQGKRGKGMGGGGGEQDKTEWSYTYPQVRT